MTGPEQVIVSKYGPFCLPSNTLPIPADRRCQKLEGGTRAQICSQTRPSESRDSEGSSGEKLRGGGA